MKRIKLGRLEAISEGKLIKLRVANRSETELTLNQEQLRKFIRFSRESLQSELDQRNTQRGSVSPSSALRILFSTPGGKIPVAVRNVGLSGALVDLPKNGPLKSLALGIHFPSCVQEGELTPPPSLIRIVNKAREEFDKRWQLVGR
jgi:hypothetical protein